MVETMTIATAGAATATKASAFTKVTGTRSRFSAGPRVRNELAQFTGGDGHVGIEVVVFAIAGAGGFSPSNTDSRNATFLSCSASSGQTTRGRPQVKASRVGISMAMC